VVTKSQRNEQLLRAGIEATNRGDEETVLALFDPEVESYVAPGLGNPGTWHGIDGYVEMISAWNESFDEMHNEIIIVEVRGGRAIRFHIYGDRKAALAAI